MTLVDRYLGAVRDNLPRAQRDDIIEELEDSLRSRMEDEAAARGRPLTEAEEAAILKSFGNPMAVAARYRGDERSVTFGRRLIGPELFPTYMKVLTVNVVITLIIGAVILLLGGTIASTFPGILVPLLIQFAVVTLVFMAIDRRFVLHPDAWDPRTVSSIGSDVDVSTIDGLADQLIGPTSAKVVRITTSVLEFGLAAIITTIWISIGLPASIGPMEPGPGWTDVWLAATVLFVISAINPLVTLVRPSWVRFRAASRAFVDVGLDRRAGLVPGARQLAGPRGSDDGDRRRGRASWTRSTTIIRVSIAVAIVIVGLSGALEIRRFRQLAPEPVA